MSDMYTEEEVPPELEGILKKHGVKTVVRALSDICYCEAIHLSDIDEYGSGYYTAVGDVLDETYYRLKEV